MQSLSHRHRCESQGLVRAILGNGSTRKPDAKTGAATGLAIDGDFSTKQLQNTPGQIESQAHAFVTAVILFFNLPEPIKNHLLVFRINANTRILHDNLDAAVD